MAVKSFPKAADETGDMDGSDDRSAHWIDLFKPSDDEIDQVQNRYGIIIPTRRSLEKIDASSRLSARTDALYMSAPLISGASTNYWTTAPVGFILSPDVFVTVRFDNLESFNSVIADINQANAGTPADMFTRLLEELVDRTADHLERASALIDETSQTIFFSSPKRRRLSHETKMMRSTMRQIGQASDRISRVRYTFLSIGRMADFALERCPPKIVEEVRERLEAVGRDIRSLDEFESSLSGRIQLLQDAAAGFISIEQNDVFKLLTVVSVVGVPPVLVVGVYGMNFKYMPELSWRLGYPYALALCLLSIVLPLLWFKWRDWI